MSGTQPPSPLRTRVYVDGYNFYYGCLRATPYKWLDLLSLFESHILPSALIEDRGHQLVCDLLPLGIKYFTAVIVEQAAKADDSVSCQARYHTALSKLHGTRIELIKGYYSLTESKSKIVDPDDPKRWPRFCQEITVWKLEEKQTDVNLALQLYHDALTGQVDHVVVATNDTDIAPALRMIRENTSVKVGVVVPTRDHQRVPNTDLVKYAHWTRTHITDAELMACQLPRVIGGRKPTIKPMSWYAAPETIESIIEQALPVVGSRGSAFKWLEAPNERFDGRSPIEFLDHAAGIERVEHYIRDYVAQLAAKANISETEGM